ncbi:hypothetical protein [Isoptericola rhizosphaerae]|uniref:hypothetical protein n=1 Tax=Isoptericola rhizosphaerae TaxID=3377837 RepID=UPI00383B9443
MRTAASAVQRGHTFAEWAALVTEARSNLGRQVAVKASGKDRPPRDRERTLRSAWVTAAAWVDEAPAPISPADVTATIAAVRAFVEDADAPLTDTDREVLAAACDLAEHHRTTRPALPRRALAASTGLGERAVRDALDRLDRRRLLTCVVRGRPAAPGSNRRRASLYRLPDRDALDAAYLYRGTRSMGPPAQVYGTPAVEPAGTPARSMGPPNGATDMDTLTLALSPEQRAVVLAALARHAEAVAADDPPAAKPSNVVPLRREAAT